MTSIGFKTEDVFYAQASLTSILSKPYNKAFEDSKPDDVNVGVLAVLPTFGEELLNLPPGLKLSKTMVKPNTLGAHIRAQPTTKIEVWASGDRLWHGDVCGVDVREPAKNRHIFQVHQGRVPCAPADELSLDVRDIPARSLSLQGLLGRCGAARATTR